MLTLVYCVALRADRYSPIVDCPALNRFMLDITMFEVLP